MDRPASTVDSWNRHRDRSKLEARLGLPEFPASGVTYVFADRASNEVARGYERVLYGDHGAYVEFLPSQLSCEAWRPLRSGDYYDLRQTAGGALAYFQKKRVDDRPNPPQGRHSVRRSREDGYADYRIGYVYVGWTKLAVSTDDGATWRQPQAPTTSHCHSWPPLPTAGEEVALWLTCAKGDERRLRRELSETMSAMVATETSHPFAAELAYPGVWRCRFRDAGVALAALPSMVGLQYVANVFADVASGTFSAMDDGAPAEELATLELAAARGVRGTRGSVALQLWNAAALDDGDRCGALTFRVKGKRGGSAVRITSDDAKRAVARGLVDGGAALSLRPPAFATTPTLKFVVRVHDAVFWVGLTLHRPDSTRRGGKQARAGAGQATERRFVDRVVGASPFDRGEDEGVTRDPNGEGKEWHLDRWAAGAFKGAVTSRSHAKRLAERGLLLVNGRERRDRGRYVRAGDVVSLVVTTRVEADHKRDALPTKTPTDPPRHASPSTESSVPPPPTISSDPTTGSGAAEVTSPTTSNVRVGEGSPSSGLKMAAQLPEVQKQELLFSYDTARYPFRELVREILLDYSGDGGSVPKLEELHLSPEGALTVSCDRRPVKSSRNVFNKRWRTAVSEGGSHRERVRTLLSQFCAEVCAPLLESGAGAPCGVVVHQAMPTLRVHLPGTGKALGTRHRDSDYLHQPNEVNFWLPLVHVFDSNTLFTESAPGAADFHPLEAQYGQCVRFWGNACEHFTMPNETGVTRVSLDFRVVPARSFEPDFVAPNSKVASARFRLGEWCKC